MPSVNRVKDIWSSGRAAFGMWCGIPGAAGIELFSGADLDYVCIDRQHGLIGFDAMAAMIRAVESIGATPFVRVPQNEAWMVMHALDAGALGVIVPLMNDAADARRAVSACRFPPDGTRSYGPIRAAKAVGSADPKILGGEVLCVAQIETKEGLENAEDICSTSGLDGVYIGPADLAITMAIPPDEATGNPDHAEAVEYIRRTCEKNGIASGVHTTSGAAAKECAERGFTMVNAGVDYVMLPEAARREMEKLEAERGRNDAGYSHPPLST
ncbi:MAG: HpcH/HpaI aldolase family protein [Rubrobacteraceae bacterium]